MSDRNALQDIIRSNHAANSDAMLNNPANSGVPIINEVFNNFFDVYDRALVNHNNAKNVEMVAGTGSVYAVGVFNGLNVTITGLPYLIMQRNSNGELYTNFQIAKMQIPYLASAEVSNTYYFSGSKYYTEQFYERKVYSQRGFIEAYNYSLSNFISTINKDTVTVDEFSYDPYSERYTAKITFKQEGNGNLAGINDYTKMLTKATDNPYTGPANIKVTQRSITFIISKNCQLVAMASNEHWSGSVHWTAYNLLIKLEVDFSLLWTFNYPTKISIKTFTF